MESLFAHECEPGDLRSINTQDLIAFAETHQTLSDLDSILNDVEQQQEIQYVADAPCPDYTTMCVPDHWNKFPTFDNVDSAYAFDIHVEPAEKINWEYSPKLEKVYIKLNSVMNLNVSYVVPPRANYADHLYVRAMIVFSSSSEMHLPVARCPNHRVHSDARAVLQANEVPAFHILKCCHPDTIYAGAEGQQTYGNRASLIVPLDRQARLNDDGRRSQSLGLEFLCQNSCSNGIHRKQTVLMLTLENDRRELLGKKLMHFKVCSCPKRDMFKDHNTIPKARKREAVAPPPPSVARHPNKMVCTRPTLPQTQIKSEPATPSPPSSTGDGGDVSPLSMFQPQPMPLLLSPDMARDEHLEPKFQMMTEQMVQLTLTVPSSSALHVLRCAYGDIMAKMANDKFNPDQFVPYAEEIQKQIEMCSNDPSNIQ